MNTNNLILLGATVFLLLSQCDNVNGRRSVASLNKLLKKNKRDESGRKMGRLRGRSTASRPRKPLPTDWEKSKHSNTNLKCGESYSVPKNGYIRFVMKSKSKTCYHGFLGSRAQNCTVGVLCHGVFQFSNPSSNGGCVKEIVALSDGSTGFLGGCGTFSFEKRPRKPRNGGTDLHLTYQGESLSTPCAAFCLEDLTTSHTQNGMGKPVKLPKATNFKGYDTRQECVCGKRKDFGRVVGGSNAQKFEFPWLGFIAFSDPSEYKRNVFCGASLISDRHVITAAHCIVPDDIKAHEIDFVLHAHVVDKRVGEEWQSHDSIPGWDLPPASDNDEGSIRMKVSQIVNHPLFDANTFDYDITVLKLKTHVNLFDGKVAPICLPKLTEIINYIKGQNMIVAGWGLPYEDAPAGSRVLQKLDMPFEELKTCMQYTKPTFRHICAGYTSGSKDSCTGDSGGPLISMLDQSKNQYVLAGVVSAGVGCARRNKLGVYSNVQELLSWVTFNVAQDNAVWCER